MDFLTNNLLFKDQIITFFIATLFALIVYRLFFKNGLINSLLYRETSIKEDTYNFIIKKIQGDIRELKNLQSEKFTEEFKSQINEYIESYLSENLEASAKQKLKEYDFINQSFDERILPLLSEKLDTHISTLDADNIIKFKNKKSQEKKINYSFELLTSTIEKERSTAGILKTVMINLFIFVNFGMLLIYFFRGNSIAIDTVYSIAGLYISLAMFVIYIFRSSNSRTSTLLAIREDMYKQLMASDYTADINNARSLSENDIEYIKMILQNHSEREKSVKHPYELIFKGITDSNIQLSSGKINLSKDSK